MKPSEAALVLAAAARYDRRTTGALEAQAWAEALTGLDVRACVDAVTGHYSASTDWLMPAHVRRLAKVAPTADSGLCRRCKAVHAPDEDCAVLKVNPDIRRQVQGWMKRRELSGGDAA